MSKLSFEEVFSSPSFCIGEAPGRVNLLGEHTDYNDGFVLPIAIPQKTRVAMKENSDNIFKVHASALDKTAQFIIETPPPEQFANYIYGCICEIKERGAVVPSLDIYIDSNVPIGVGLSSSAALEIATLRALRKSLKLSFDDVLLAQIGQTVEAKYIGLKCGIMDQMASSLADSTSMLFLDTKTLNRKLLPLPEDSEVLVVDSGTSRALANSGYNERRSQCEEAARLLGVTTLRDVADVSSVEILPEPYRSRALHVVTENNRVLKAAEGVSAKAFGKLMNESHRSLRDDYEVSVPELDDLAELLQSHPDVYGAKLTGAGFGGACVCLCRAGKATDIAKEVLEKYNKEGHNGRLLVPV